MGNLQNKKKLNRDHTEEDFIKPPIPSTQPPPGVSENPTNERIITNSDIETFDDGNIVTFIIVGCGMRGQMYAHYALEKPHLCKLVAIAEPREKIRENMKNWHKLEDSHVFKDWREITEKGEKIADAVFICTQDKDHHEPAVAFSNLKYHVLLEKPMARTENECEQIAEAVKKNDVHFAVCHVMRYALEAQVVKELLDEKKIGQILHIQHIEPVGYWHFAHSYVRGNWCRERDSNFILMTKSCHDIDLITFYMNSRCTKISSFGSLTHFKKENKPVDSGHRCLDCKIEKQCPYSAKRRYIEGFGPWCKPLMKDGQIPDIENVTEALKTGPYGVCVYDSDNDVCDHQVVQMTFENGATASFTLIATSRSVCQRQTSIFGSLGEIFVKGSKVEYKDFVNNRVEICTKQMNFEDMGTHLACHGYADFFLVKNFIDSIRTKDKSKILSDADSTLLSHKLCFLAEKARKESKVIEVPKKEEEEKESDGEEI